LAQDSFKIAGRETNKGAAYCTPRLVKWRCEFVGEKFVEQWGYCAAC